MLNGQENALRDCIGKMLADGLKTKTEPFPEDNHQFAALLAALSDLAADFPEDVTVFLIEAGSVAWVSS